MADNKILDSDSLVAIREFVNNKIDEKIAESGGSGGSSSDHKEFLRIKQDIFFTIANNDKFYCAVQYKNGSRSRQITNKYRGIRVGQKALFGTYSRNIYLDDPSTSIQLTNDINNTLNINFIKNAVSKALGLGEYNVQWATPRQCWENWGRAFREWGLIYQNIVYGNPDFSGFEDFNSITKRYAPMPEEFWWFIQGQCFKLPYPQIELLNFIGSGDSFGLRRKHQTNRISIKFYKENAEGKKTISKYQLIVHLKVVREDWTEDSGMSDSLDPQYIIGYVYPAIVRDFDFKDSYYNYIEEK